MGRMQPKDPELKKTYTDALNFGPEEEKLGADIKQYHDEMLAEAMRAGALEEGMENYIHRYYPRESDPARQRLEGALNELRFTKNFSGFKKRFYESDFDAEQAGLKPEKDASKRILAYDQGFRKALTARAFVKDRYSATMPDGLSRRSTSLASVFQARWIRSPARKARIWSNPRARRAVTVLRIIAE